ncbi:DUF294 nucleotidyltransferase-like domain-containing protein [Janibacter limosus]|uniref:DUF294 nucleotidyltransferase-like domain-containing protein n=1 Tax=Janibacter limosus TaxID=53458 RepID=UPI000837690A|nr:DUF294 nucleotidyltransferase-like domain-containing protein [Janibacter limosus]
MADTELAEVADFLAGHAPFAALPVRVLRALPARLTIRYHRRGSSLMAVGVDNHDLIIVRSGAIEIRDADGGLVDRCAEGSTAGSTTLVGSNPSRFDVVAIEDTLALHLPGEVFHELSQAYPDFADHFDAERADRLRTAASSVATNPAGEAILRTSARDLVLREPVSVPDDVTIAEAARVMTDEGVSSLLVMDGQGLAGILTDRDLRRRVVAAGLDPAGPVTSVMTPDPVVAAADASALELLVTMTERTIHHLPVLEGGRPLGVVTTTDLMRLERVNMVHIVGDVSKQPDVAGVVAMAQRLPRLVEQLVGQDVAAGDITRVVTTVGDAIERRLITLAEDELTAAGHGPPPRYCWMTLGSRARHEQALGGDQDHAVILADDAPEGAEDYIGALAEIVVAGLEACGYPRCEGDVMASNPRWRQRLTGWRREFRQWIHEPTSDAVLTASIFFDSRPLAGDEALHARLAQDIATWAPQGHNFLGHLVAAAVANEPPLGFFRGFVLARAGDHKDTLDLKRGGVGAIVDLARAHALGAGLVSVNTRSRLLAAGRAGALDPAIAASLVDALEFISHVRLAHQSRQAAAGVTPDSRLRPSELTPFEQRTLREAFHVVRAAQQALAQRTPAQHLT